MRKNAPILSCFHLGWSVPPSRGSNQENLTLLNDLSFELDRGSWNEFVGPSGGGKSLLFSLLSLRLPPQTGKLVVDGRNFHRLSKKGVSELRKRFASCSEEPLLLEGRSVIENMVLPFVVRRDQAGAVERCQELLEEAKLDRLRDVPVASLSRQERLAVAALRALAGKPTMLFVDNVLSQVDDEMRATLLRMMQRAHLDGTTVVSFGREASPQSRRGVVFSLVDGAIEERVDYGSKSQAPTPEAGGRS